MNGQPRDTGNIWHNTMIEEGKKQTDHKKVKR